MIITNRKLFLNLERERYIRDIRGKLRSVEVFLAFAFDFKKSKIQSMKQMDN